MKPKKMLVIARSTITKMSNHKEKREVVFASVAMTVVVVLIMRV
tara:strand:- start:241 stop:372 length:132 start_codon:yes stop_codon:yes gene_type:complete